MEYKNKKIIGVDLDDVLLDFNANLCKFYNKKFNTSLKRENIISFELAEIWGCTVEEARKIVADFYKSDQHKGALPIKEAPSVIKKLSKNRELYIISARPEYLRKETTEWLNKHYGSVFNGVHLISQYHNNGDTTKKTKAEVCDELGVEIFIDDSLDNANSIANDKRTVLLLDTPWNQGKLNKNIKRVYSWKEIFSVLEK